MSSEDPKNRLGFFGHGPVTESQQTELLLADNQRLREKIAKADSFLADPAGNPIDAINFARAALMDEPAGEPVETT